MTDPKKELNDEPIKTNHTVNGEYALVEGNCGDNFVKKVNELCKKGYSPVGGIFVHSNWLVTCRQAMYKKDNTER